VWMYVDACNDGSCRTIKYQTPEFDCFSGFIGNQSRPLLRSLQLWAADWFRLLPKLWHEPANSEMSCLRTKNQPILERMRLLWVTPGLETI
jgi:hypothetical protein